MLTELCQDLRNWFDRERYFGTFEIRGGVISGPGSLLDGQYYRIVGSIFNDGVHKYGDVKDLLTDETFDGAVWALAIPKAVIELAAEIAAWRARYEAADSPAMSPFMSESFGGYSYTKGSALTSKNTTGGTNWQATFANRLNAWRKL